MSSALSLKAALPAVAAPRRALAPAAAPAPARAPACHRAGLQRRSLGRIAATAVDVQADAKYPAWEMIFRDLTGAGVPTLSPEDAFDAVELGRAVLIDVRPQEDHDKGHPRGSKCVPAFLTIDAPSSPGEWGKWLACKANGVVPTKPNPELPKQIAAAAAGGKAVILACEAGGTLEPSVNFPQGKVSRSLKAAWKVVRSGALPAEQVKHLQGGVFGWFQAGLPMEGEYDGSGAGRTPNTAEKPTGAFIDKR